MSDFIQKLDLLRRQKGLSVRALATELGVGVGTVGGWLKEFRPRPQVARRLADFFDVSVEDLLDDTRELPVRPEHNIPLNTPPLQAAAAEAQRAPGETPAGQDAFQKYLEQIRAMRAEAERLAAGDQAKAIELFDHMLATWRATHEAGEERAGAQPDKATRGRKPAKAPKFVPVTLPSQTQALSTETGKPLPAARPLPRARPA